MRLHYLDLEVGFVAVKDEFSLYRGGPSRPAPNELRVVTEGGIEWVDPSLEGDHRRRKILP